MEVVDQSQKDKMMQESAEKAQNEERKPTGSKLQYTRPQHTNNSEENEGAPKVPIQ